METLPNWLDQSPSLDIMSGMEFDPDFPIAKSPAQKIAEMRLAETVFEIIFDDTLDKIMLAQTLRLIVEEYNKDHPFHPIEMVQYQRWIMRDKVRKQQWRDAKEMGTHIVFDDMMDIADGKNNPLEDVQRSKLRVETRRFGVKAYNPKTFGDEVSAVGSGMGGGVTVNITSVASPYANQTAIPVVTPIVTDDTLVIDV